MTADKPRMSESGTLGLMNPARLPGPSRYADSGVAAGRAPKEGNLQ
jgi:hypothetical protein